MKNQSTLRKQADERQFRLTQSTRSATSSRSITSSWDKGDNINGFFGEKKKKN